MSERDALMALVEQWRKKYPAEKLSTRQDDDYWYGQKHAANRCADDLAALLQAAAPPAPIAERKWIASGMTSYTADGEVTGHVYPPAAPPERVSEGEENRPQVVEARLDQIRSALQVEWRLKTEQGIHHDHLSDLAFLIAEVEYLQAAARPAVDPPERVSEGKA